VLSDLLDVLGLAAIVAGVYILLGPGASLLAGGAALMFTARAMDDPAANRALSRLLARGRRVASSPARIVRRARGVKSRAA
jgi:hypothetical protein